MSRSVSVRCPGKVNLHLEVLGKRRDGYHELSTLFAAVGVWDEVRVTPDASGEIALAVEPEGTVSAGGDNLVARAARAALAAWGVPRGARITLRKEIPVGGGMGGGSADAAATLIALAALWGERRSQQELADVASSLGSDVPYFLLGGGPS
jgi:4-diphosphocytidyl-2-C-methyl-D-erythritol kinase